MNLLFHFLTGLIQGLTEFLPVSSSGHLVLFQHLYGRGGLEENLFLNVMVHLGTMVAIIVVFRKLLKELIIDFFSIPKMIKKDGFKSTMSQHSIRFILAVIVGSVPAFFVGYFLHDQISGINSLLFVGFMFLITAMLLFASRIFDKKESQRSDESSSKTSDSYGNIEQGRILSIPKGFVIGIAQAIAILPGISRSGSTISTGRLVGLNRDTAASFSFLMSLPAIFGASILEFVKVSNAGFSGIDIVGVLIGFITSLIVGWISLVFLIRFIKKGKFYYFGFYLVLVSLVCFIFHFIG